MFLSVQTVGKLVMTVNVLLTGGVIVAGGSLFMSDPPKPQALPGVFERADSETGAAPAVAESAFEPFKDITVDKFLAVAPPTAQPNARHVPVPTPGVGTSATNAIKVKGIMLSNREKYCFAVLEVLRTKEQVTASPGDTVEGIQIVRIKTDGVLVNLNGVETELPLIISDDGIKARKPAAKKKKGRSSRSSRRPRPAAPAGRRSDMEVRKVMKQANAEARAAGMKPMPSAEEMSSMSKAEIIKRLPPSVQRMWAKLSPEDKAKYEKRFRKYIEAKMRRKNR